MRALAKAPDATGSDLRRQVREGFRKHANERDGAAIKSLLAEGNRQLAFAKAIPTSNDRAVTDSDSWVGTGEAWDIRGRIGTRWPWRGD